MNGIVWRPIVFWWSRNKTRKPLSGSLCQLMADFSRKGTSGKLSILRNRVWSFLILWFWVILRMISVDVGILKLLQNDEVTNVITDSQWLLQGKEQRTPAFHSKKILFIHKNCWHIYVCCRLLSGPSLRFIFSINRKKMKWTAFINI